MIPGSRETYDIDGSLYIRFEINHAGVVQLGYTNPAPKTSAAGVLTSDSLGQLLPFAVMLLGVALLRKRSTAPQRRD